MKKTFTINISGIIFHIDEDAYNQLNNYLENVKRHFRDSEGGEEIINDIESRIAEILSEKLSDTKQVITINDINQVIDVMGQPSEFAEEAEDTKNEKQSSQQKEQYYTPHKRLFRDPDNKVIGGVSSGIAAYFNIDPLWIRLLFLITLFAGGTGILIYIILWIAMPEARTTSDRLHMRGEPVNINNIEKSIREEFEDLKTRINDISDRAKSSYKKKRDGGQTFFENLLNLFVDVLRIFGKALIILIGVVVVIIALSLLIPFLMMLFGAVPPVWSEGSDIIAFSIPYMANMILGPGSSNGLFIAALILFIGIPLFMLLYLGIRVIFRLPRTRFVGVSALALWIVSLIFMSYYTMKVVSDLKYEGDYKSTVYYQMPANDTLFLEMNNNMLDQEERGYVFLDTDDGKIVFTEDEQMMIAPELNIKASENDSIEFIEERSSRGRSPMDSKTYARNILYNYTFESNTLTFDKYMGIEKDEPFRGQELDILVRIPVGSVVYIEEELETLLDWWHFNDPWQMGGKYWTMTKKGLKEERE
ncbi:MAG: PspC domain-containing protein [Bacteroidales bacterium]|nr:PspC domain-containing protein [Bacteroidales bacterium]MCF8350783.1 PspC domain-containing protein [Bacteroidales bacterium]MCF8376851.1 PspC domain-containing protein [Bacteroidales bacterium]MCF8401866.1 PspC domain-containing protein [Bacteroidales bacterium]